MEVTRLFKVVVHLSSRIIGRSRGHFSSVFRPSCNTRPCLLKLYPLWNTNTVHFTTSTVRYTSTMGSSSSKTVKISSRREMSHSPSDDYVEAVVCQESDLQENEMKSFELGDAGKVLVIKQKGTITAIGAKCTHYGAPLQTGVLGQGRVRCPWHGACFNVTTGDIEDFPGLDSLPCYQVTIQNGGVKVRAKKEEVKSSKRVKNMTSMNRANRRTFVVVGGGAAGACCVETLRQEGFDGRIIFVCKEPIVPYDRIKLSKALDLQVEKISLRPAEFYKSNGIDVVTGTEVVSLDSESKVLKLNNGEELKYDAVFLATGALPRRPPIPGAELKNIHVLRTVEEANAIAQELNPEKNVVILGASFIGMEVAAFCVDKVKSVTVVGKDDVPFQAVLGKEVGARLMELHKEKKVLFKMQSGISRFLADDSGDSVNQVELTDGSLLPADVCILGIGASPATQYLEGSGVNLNAGAVIVNKHMESNIKGVYAGGDIAYAPILDSAATIGHWQLAHYHGHTAALNMVGKPTEINTVPFFWTMLFGKGIRYAGYAPKFDEVVIGGSLEELKFVAHYIVGNDVRAIATCGTDPAAAMFAERLTIGKQLHKSDLQSDPLKWTTACNCME